MLRIYTEFQSASFALFVMTLNFTFPAFASNLMTKKGSTTKSYSTRKCTEKYNIQELKNYIHLSYLVFSKQQKF